MNQKIQQEKGVWKTLLIAKNERSHHNKKRPKQQVNYRSFIQELIYVFQNHGLLVYFNGHFNKVNFKT